MFFFVVGIGVLCFLGFKKLLGNIKFTTRKYAINYVFGVPGSGKTTLLVHIAKTCHKHNLKLRKKIKNLKHNKNYDKNLEKLKKQFINIYSNIDLKDIKYFKIDMECIGKYRIANGILLIDESSVEMNNRDYKSLSKQAIKFFKYHRHFNVNIWVFSQSYEDTDITIRRLSTNYYKVRKSPFYFITKNIICEKINKIIFIEKEKKQIIEGFEKLFFGKYKFNARRCFKYFDSFSQYYLPPIDDYYKKKETKYI